MDVFEAMESAMTMRWLSDEPVPDEMIEKLIWAATRAPSPENSQLWDFVVVKSAEMRQRFHEAVVPPILAMTSSRPSMAANPDPVKRRMGEGASNLITNLRDVPVLIFVCGSSWVPGDPREDRYQFSAIYGATQNMIVAGRAMGLGIAATGLHHFNTRAVRAMLNVPDHKIIGMTVAVGWPTRPFGPVKRKPISEVMHSETW